MYVGFGESNKLVFEITLLAVYEITVCPPVLGQVTVGQGWQLFEVASPDVLLNILIHWHT
jgi:hypothetical protein